LHSEEPGSHLNRWFMTEDFVKSWNQISSRHVAPYQCVSVQCNSMLLHWCRCAAGRT
jgi:hypothetical protein